MNAIEILTNDNQKIYTLLEQLDDCHLHQKDELDTLFKKTSELLMEHIRAEENFLYPRASELKDDDIQPLIEKSCQANHFTRAGFLELHLVPYRFSSWKPKFQAIKDNLVNHMPEEEELFDQIRKRINKEELNIVGEKIINSRK